MEASNAMKALPPGRGAAAIAVIAAKATISTIAVEEFILSARFSMQQ